MKWEDIRERVKAVLYEKLEILDIKSEDQGFKLIEGFCISAYTKYYDSNTISVLNMEYYHLNVTLIGKRTGLYYTFSLPIILPELGIPELKENEL